MTKPILVVCLMALLWSCNTGIGQEEHRYTNKLATERSPYLLQHAHNPVDWYPWGDEALQKAQEEDKLLIISIGYSACHWCHVMEHESFEDSLVAAVMNEHFVSIKVDREERPDIDDIYMTACQMAGEGGCGWPLNAFALPNGQPVWAGTYFPKDNWLEILEYFRALYQDDPDQLREYAVQLTEGIEAAAAITPYTGSLDFVAEELDQVNTTLLGRMDFTKGGRLGAPKFPIPNTFEYLLRYHGMTGHQQSLDAVVTTLDNMAMGGIYDHLGGGFARYSTDPDWIVPHFEKMLYDNAQLISLYSQAYQLTQNPLYEQVIRETLAFISRELTAPNGGFYASLDADSEGKEGAFYTWPVRELDSLLTDEAQNALFQSFYEVKRRGNWEDGENILYRRTSLEEAAAESGLTEAEVETQLAAARQTLFTARAQRERPGLDDKILTAWNGLMIKGYVDAYRALGETKYLEAALRNANFIVAEILQEDNRLVRHHESGINAFLDDYAFVIQAFAALYEVTFDESWLARARDLTQYAIDHFQNSENGMFYYTSDLDEALVTRKLELYDNVIPASNSVMARNLFLLGNLYYQPEWVELSQQMLLNIWQEAVETDFPDSYSNWCQLFLEQRFAPYEVAIVGEQATEVRNILMQAFLPNAHFLGGISEGSLELLKDKLVEGETFIYVCQNKICKLPVTDAESALGLLRE
jgi:uncharacterized protein YyaL (SSP411 family)